MTLGTPGALIASPQRSKASGSGLAHRPSQKRLARAVRRLVHAVRAEKGKLSLAVRETETGVLWAGHQEKLPVNPASNVKILTAWAALRILGPQHRYLTSLHGQLAEGGHVSRLAIAGDGDPDLEMRHLYEMIARLKRGGLRSVGDIVVDQSAFDGQHVPPAFGQQPEEWASFRASVAAVSLAGNTAMFEMRPGTVGRPVHLAVVPGGFVTVTGHAQTSAAGKPPALRLKLKANRGRVMARLGGTLPVDAKVVRLWRRVADPTLLVGYGLRTVCADLGIVVKGVVKAGPAAPAKELSRHRSRPLARLLHALGKYSNNFYAEMVFKRLGAPIGDGKPASFHDAAAAVRGLLEQAKIDTAGLRLQNGSGLFDANRISASLMTAVLRAAWRDGRVRPELMSQLAIGGTDGTLRSRFKGLRESRMVRGKTGTLAQVSALSGYVTGERRTLAFSVLIDDVRGHAAAFRQDIDAFVRAVAAETDDAGAQP
jgi:D-alanyl-D-alanine carboxypeptidase/D-alanyl-D-alanine-endopeptidase (penicillin-binding protein 4)